MCEAKKKEKRKNEENLRVFISTFMVFLDRSCSFFFNFSTHPVGVFRTFYSSLSTLSSSFISGDLAKSMGRGKGSGSVK